MADNEDFMSQDDEDVTSEQGNEESEDEQTGAAASKSDEESSREELLKKLQSERDKETARANKLAKQLEEMKTQSTAKGKSKTTVPPEVEQWITAAKQNARKTHYEANAKLARYGVDPALIVGDTPEEMAKSAESLSKFVEEMEAKVRGEVLVEHGFDPEPRTSTSPGRQSFRDMPKEDFDKLVEEALRG